MVLYCETKFRTTEQTLQALNNFQHQNHLLLSVGQDDRTQGAPHGTFNQPTFRLGRPFFIA